MALLKCPECSGNVSSEAEKCIHCGYPLKQKTIINGIAYDLSNELTLALEDKSIEAIRLVREKTGLGLANGKSVVDFMIRNKKCPSVLCFDEKIVVNTPHCPFCKSTNIHKITGTERAMSVIGLGVFSKKINKSFKCNNCGGTF